MNMHARANGRMPGMVMIIFGAIFVVGPLLIWLNQESHEPGSWMVVLLFSFVGLAIIGGGIFLRRSGSATARLRKAHPDEPWLHRPEWAEGRIRDDNRLTAILISVFALVWLGIVGTISIAAWNSDDADNLVRIFLGVFLLVGFGLAAAAIRQLLRLKRFGVSEFVLSEVPGVIGGTLGGVVLTKVHLDRHQGFDLKLQSVRRVTTGSGKNSHTTESVIWEDEAHVAEEALPDDHRQSAIPVYFEIPFTCEPTARPNASEEYFWRLEVSAKLPGMDYRARFTVPVFRTPKSREDFQAKRAIAAPDLSGEALRDAWAEEGVRLEVDEPHHLIFTRSGRTKPRGAIVSLVMAIGFGIGAYFLHHSPVPLPMTVIMGLFSLISLVIGFFIIASSSRLEVRPGHLHLHNRIGPWGRITEVDGDDFLSLKPVPGTIVNNRTYYNLKLETASGRSRTITLNTAKLRKAESIGERVEAVLRGVS